MIKLMHNDVDDYLDCWGEWPEMPTETELTDLLAMYYTDDQANFMACELLSGGEAHVGNSCNTVFTLV